MQIPRGTFRSLNRGVQLSSFLAELINGRFSGSCVATRGDHSLMLVFRDGNLLLAECGALTGDPAWDAALVWVDAGVDAALTELTPAQIALALEFNEASRVKRQHMRTIIRGVPGRQDPAANRESSRTFPPSMEGSAKEVFPVPPPVESPGLPVHSAPSYSAEDALQAKRRDGFPVPEVIPLPAEPLPGQQSPTTATTDDTAHPGMSQASTPAPDDITIPGEITVTPPVKSPGPVVSSEPIDSAKDVLQQAGEMDKSPDPKEIPAEAVPTPEQESHGGSQALDDAAVSRELDALDAMDLETMSEKIRINCRQMMERLHLDYLIVDREE